MTTCAPQTEQQHRRSLSGTAGKSFENVAEVVTRTRRLPPDTALRFSAAPEVEIDAGAATLLFPKSNVSSFSPHA